MTTLDEAREMARRMRQPPNVSLDVARVLDWLIAMVEKSRTVTDAEVEAAFHEHMWAGLYTDRSTICTALEAAAAARSQASGTNAKAVLRDGLNRED